LYNLQNLVLVKTNYCLALAIFILLGQQISKRLFEPIKHTNTEYYRGGDTHSDYSWGADM